MRWDLVPGHTALVVIDPQNDFLHQDGWYSRAGIDISHMQRAIEPIRALVAAARARHVPVIWTRHGFRDERDAGVFFHLRPFLKDGGLRQGTWGYEVLDGLGATPDDWYVEKTRLSAFYNTNLESILRALQAGTVLFPACSPTSALRRAPRMLTSATLSQSSSRSARAPPFLTCTVPPSR